MRRITLFVAVCLTALLSSALRGADDEVRTSKEALQALNDYIGIWKGNGSPEKVRPDPDDTWNETVDWAWRFKGDDAWLIMKVKKGKYLKTAELRFLPDKNRYQLTATTVEGKKLVFEGDLMDEILVFERVDRTTKETQRIKMNLAGDGIRFIYRVEHKPAGRTIYFKDYLVAFTKEGQTLAAKEKKVECVVSGGLGTIPVSFNGKTYFVCCSGCKDAFMENPAKYVKEFEAKKAAMK